MPQVPDQTQIPPCPSSPGQALLRVVRRAHAQLDRLLSIGSHELWLHGCVALTALLVVWSALATPFPARSAQLARQTAPAAVLIPTPVHAAAEPGPSFRFQDMSPDQAILWNLITPLSYAPNPPAKPFVLGKDDGVAYERAVNCLTAAVYYEAASESGEGQEAVAQVVLNRMRHPAYPKTVCGVVFEGAELATGCQFSFTCDGSLARNPSLDGWRRARETAIAALAGSVARGVGQATHYHALYVAPYWSPNLLKVRSIGLHIFYRWSGGWGMPGAFKGVHAGEEAYVPRLAMLDAALSPPPAQEAVPSPVLARLEIGPSEMAAGLGLRPEPPGEAAPAAEAPASANAPLAGDMVR
jgi:spore germination cell wall hydrolase CwlJ-like protein